jgi:hypothetical protein
LGAMPGAARHKSDVGWRRAGANKFRVTSGPFPNQISVERRSGVRGCFTVRSPYSKCGWPLRGRAGHTGPTAQRNGPSPGKAETALGGCRGRPGTNVQSCRPIARSFTIQRPGEFEGSASKPAPPWRSCSAPAALCFSVHHRIFRYLATWLGFRAPCDKAGRGATSHRNAEGNRCLYHQCDGDDQGDRSDDHVPFRKLRDHPSAPGFCRDSDAAQSERSLLKLRTHGS